MIYIYMIWWYDIIWWIMISIVFCSLFATIFKPKPILNFRLHIYSNWIYYCCFCPVTQSKTYWDNLCYLLLTFQVLFCTEQWCFAVWSVYRLHISVLSNLFFFVFIESLKISLQNMSELQDLSVKSGLSTYRSMKSYLYINTHK